jgi:methyl-accepting chemotaxis protein
MSVIERLMLEDLHRRNGLMFKANVAIVGLAILAIVSLGLSNGLELANFYTLVPTIIGMIILGFLHYRQMITSALPYCFIFMPFISSAITILSEPDFTATLSSYYLVVLAIIYMRLKPFLFGVGLALVELLMLMFMKGNQLTVNEDSLTTAMIYFFIIAIVMFFIIRSSDALFSRVNQLSEETMKMSAQGEAKQQRLIKEVKIISDNMSLISRGGLDNERSFEQMNIAFREIASGAGEQADSTVRITEAVQATNVMIEKMIGALSVLVDKSKVADEHAMLGTDKVKQLYAAITDFKQNIEQMSIDLEKLNTTIHEVVSFSNSIQDIAAQTNLLSLNASIEAARAGESGRGFAVVATEIRKLSESAASSAEQISRHLSEMESQAGSTGEMMSQVARQMEESTQLTRETRDSFTGIGSSVGQLANMVADFDQVVQTIGQSASDIEKESQSFAAVSEESTATLEELSATVESLAQKNSEITGRLKDTDQAVKRLLE